MRRKHETIEGHNISVWDDGPETIDRYTVVYLDTEDDHGKVEYLGMSSLPFSPGGFSQHGEMQIQNVCYTGRGGVFKKRIAFADLPIECQKAVKWDLAIQGNKMKPKLTHEIAHAAGKDAGDRHMRKNGRLHWNAEDYDECSKVVNRLFDIIDGQVPLDTKLKK